LLVIASSDTSSGNVVSVEATTNGSNTDALSKLGACATASSPTEQWCFYWIDRVTAGDNGVTCTFTNSGGSYKVGCVSVEIAGTAASSSFDKVEYDSAYALSAAAFTSGNTATTTQATELLIGYAFEAQGMIQGSVGTFGAGGSWTMIDNGAGAGNSPTGFGLFIQTVTSTGAYNLSGSYTPSGSMDVLPGLATFK
jgi:hypothetical protein